MTVGGRSKVILLAFILAYYGSNSTSNDCDESLYYALIPVVVRAMLQRGYLAEEEARRVRFLHFLPHECIDRPTNS